MACRACRPRLTSLYSNLSTSNSFACTATSSSLLSSRRRSATSRKLSHAPQRLLRGSNEIRPLSGGSSPLTDDGDGSARRAAEREATSTAEDVSKPQLSPLRRALASALTAVTPRTVQKYAVHRATQTLYKACANPGEYRIDEGERREGTVRRTRDGEEVGYAVDETSIWHRGM